MSSSEVEGKFSSKLELPIRIWKDLKETVVGSLACVSVSFKSGNFAGNFKCRLRCRSSYVVGCGRSSLFNSCFQRPLKPRRDWFLDNGKKEASVGHLLPHKSENRFLRLLLLCLARLGSSLHSTLPLSSSVSVQNCQYSFPFNEIRSKFPFESSIRVE